jgi:V/A-type H+/Na+-transporting ATPase subunit E
MSQANQPAPASPSAKLSTAAAVLPAVESSGVESLIDRLRDQGISAGRTQADTLITAAQKEASDIVANAQREADALLVEARTEAAKLKAAGENAVALAMRDTLLSLEGEILQNFHNSLVRLIKEQLADPQFLRRLILEVAGKAAVATADKRVQLLLPADTVSLDDLLRKPEPATPGTLMHFVQSLGAAMLRDGLSFGVSEEIQAGIQVRLVDDDVRIDLTESAMSELLLRHMLPRFRALLRGKGVVERVDLPKPKAVAAS